jgi:hypothetical protein
MQESWTKSAKSGSAEFFVHRRLTIAAWRPVHQGKQKLHL